MAASKILSPAAQAFDAIAEKFDERFGTWLSVAAQRRAVRGALEKAYPPGVRVLEIGGGAGEDALWLAQRGRQVLLTDASPLMVRIAAAKFGDLPGARAEVCAADPAGLGPACGTRSPAGGRRPRRRSRPAPHRGSGRGWR